MIQTHLDTFSQVEITNGMRLFLEREKKYDQALLQSAWLICKEIDRDRYNIRSNEKREDTYKESTLEDEPSDGYHQISYDGWADKVNIVFVKRIESNSSEKFVRDRIDPNLKKLKNLTCRKDYLKKYPFI
jgi:hypothetical protein